VSGLLHRCNCSTTGGARPEATAAAGGPHNTGRVPWHGVTGVSYTVLQHSITGLAYAFQGSVWVSSRKDWGAEAALWFPTSVRSTPYRALQDLAALALGRPRKSEVSTETKWKKRRQTRRGWTGQLPIQRKDSRRRPRQAGRPVFWPSLHTQTGTPDARRTSIRDRTDYRYIRFVTIRCVTTREHPCILSSRLARAADAARREVMGCMWMAGGQGCPMVRG
jgi:hypothetical protein